MKLFVTAGAMLPIILAVLPMRAAAQTPAASETVTLAPKLAAGELLTYELTLHTDFLQVGASGSAQATQESSMRVQVKVVSADNAAGVFEEELRFLSASTTAAAASPELKAMVQKTSDDRDKLALTMDPVRLRLGPADHFEVVARSAGTDYDQPVSFLMELARTDTLPTGSVAVGAAWQRHRTQPIPTMNAFIDLDMDCGLNAINRDAHPPTATVTVNSHGTAQPPAVDIPGYADYMKEGQQPTATMDRQSDATSQYRLDDGVLVQSSSHSRIQFNIQLLGPLLQEQNLMTTNNSTSAIKLVLSDSAVNR